MFSRIRAHTHTQEYILLFILHFIRYFCYRHHHFHSSERFTAVVNERINSEKQQDFICVNKN